MSPERPESPIEEKVFVPKISAPGSPIAGTPIRDAQSPISLLLAVAQHQNEAKPSQDDDLTSLSWLQDKDLLKGMNLVNPSPCSSIQTSPFKNSPSTVAADQSPTSDYVEDSLTSAPDSSTSSSLNSPTPPETAGSGSNARNRFYKHYKRYSYIHPHPHPAYDPFVHTANKPPYSFSCLIFMAIEDSPKKALPVKDIYAWIIEHFPYFLNAPTGWKNSVRHNLSLNKCFQKVEKAPNLGKGSLWVVDQHYRPNLLQALTRSPFHPCSTLDPSDYYKCFKNPDRATSTPNNSNNSSSNGNHHLNNQSVTSSASSSSSTPRLPNPDLFPYLSNEMSRRLVKQEPADLDDFFAADDAAAVMLSLRNGPTYRAANTQKLLISNSPSQDHTYSVSDGGGKYGADRYIHDEAFDSDEDSKGQKRNSKICRKIQFDEDDEDMRIKEGAEMLLHLAGMSSARKRTASENFERENKKALRECTENGPRAPFRPRLLRRGSNNTNNNNVSKALIVANGNNNNNVKVFTNINNNNNNTGLNKCNNNNILNGVVIKVEDEMR